jgi:hypothetical protein
VSLRRTVRHARSHPTDRRVRASSSLALLPFFVELCFALPLPLLPFASQTRVLGQEAELSYPPSLVLSDLRDHFQRSRPDPSLSPQTFPRLHGISSLLSLYIFSLDLNPFCWISPLVFVVNHCGSSTPAESALSLHLSTSLIPSRSHRPPQQSCQLHWSRRFIRRRTSRRLPSAPPRPRMVSKLPAA